MNCGRHVQIEEKALDAASVPKESNDQSVASADLEDSQVFISNFNLESSLNQDPLTLKRNVRKHKRIQLMLGLILVAVVVVTTILLTRNQTQLSSSNSLHYSPGATSPSISSLEAWVLHYSKSLPLKQVGGIQNISVAESIINPNWASWEISARRADPLTGYAYDGRTGWKNVPNGPAEAPSYLAGPPSKLPKEVENGKWRYVTLSIKGKG